MKKSIILGFVLLGIIQLKCEKNNSYNNAIIGQWQWIRSTAGDISITSESVDSTYYIDFNSKGYYHVYGNSKKLLSTAKYELIIQENLSKYRIAESGSPEFYNRFNVNNDTLSVTNLEGFISWTSYYLRLK
jgi:hypothetical protein